ncbi:FAD-dependent oxidoreductase [bacterium]|nr:FAD-dependent oxidoreductase [bacterium]
MSTSQKCLVYDVVVVGGGLAGICAAIAAARLDCKTALIHDRPVLGGNSSSEIRVIPTGANYSGLRKDLGETGIIEELLLESWYRDPLRSFCMWDTILWEWIKKEPKLTLFLNSSAQDVIMESKKRIKSIKVIQSSTEKKFTLTSDIFIDCSGDGLIAYKSGAKYRMGREGKKEFRESFAPDKPDKFLLGSSLLFVAKDFGHPVPFTPPFWAKDFPRDEDIPFRIHKDIRDGYWWIAYGGMRDTIKDNEEIRDELLKILFGIWDHIKNHGQHGAENYALDWIGKVPGKRESRRFMGDYILTQKDVQKSSSFKDAVAYGGWAIDLHFPEGIYCKEGPSNRPTIRLTGPYSIPLRCLYSQNIQNLMFAGRNISVSHVALGSTRVMLTCAVEGQAVGTAAYLCRKYHAFPRDIYQKHIGELQQQLLKDDCYIPHLRNNDESDLARFAKVETSSSLELKGITSADSSRPLNTPQAEIIPVSQEQIEKISLLLESSLAENAKIKLHFRKAQSLWDFNSGEEIVSVSTEVPARQRSWVTFALNQKITPGLYSISLPKKEGISWCFSYKELPGLQPGYLHSYWKWWIPQRGDYCFRISPSSFPYKGENVVNGAGRPESWPNIWISDPRQGFPQYLELDFGKEVTFNSVYLTFNSNLSGYLTLGDVKKHYYQQPFHFEPGPITESLKDYSLLFREGNTWIKILERKGNYQRRRIDCFKPVTSCKLRVQTFATNGSLSAQIYQIRVYLEQVKTKTHRR